jgi:hypothetical protein
MHNLTWLLIDFDEKLSFRPTAGKDCRLNLLAPAALLAHADFYCFTYYRIKDTITV